MLSFRRFLRENRERARRLLDQLSNVTVARGATEAEAANAKKRMQELRDKYKVHELDIPDFLKRKNSGSRRYTDDREAWRQQKEYYKKHPEQHPFEREERDFRRTRK